MDRQPICLFAVLSLVGALALSAQEPPKQQPQQPQLQEEVTVRWWLVPVYAIDKAGAPILDLTHDDLEVYIKNLKVEKFDIHKKQFQVTETKKSTASVPPQPQAPPQKKLVFLLFDAAFSTYNLLAKGKAIADTAIAQSDQTAQYVLLTIEPFTGLHYILGPTRDLKLLAKSMKKYVEGKRAGFLTTIALENRDIYTVDPRSNEPLDNGKQGGLGGARTKTGISDPNSLNSNAVPPEFIFDKLDWREKKRVVASYLSALMTLDVVLGQFRDYSKVIYLYSCGIPGDAFLDRTEFMEPGQWISNYTFDSVSYDALKTVGAHFNRAARSSSSSTRRGRWSRRPTRTRASSLSGPGHRERRPLLRGCQQGYRPPGQQHGGWLPRDLLPRQARVRRPGVELRNPLKKARRANLHGEEGRPGEKLRRHDRARKRSRGHEHSQ